MADLRSVYAEKGLSQIPRLLGLEDRNPFSPTYGCFKRTYWLDKVDDFPDALPQFGVLSLTLAYAHAMPGNAFHEQPKILEWILAGMRYWTQIQHKDGSFDEFYPNEHGWTGPTGFLLYAMLKSYLLLDARGEFPADFRDAFLSACRKAAVYIIRWDEHGVLANHHAMAVLPVAYAHHVLKEDALREGYEKKLAEFLSFCNPEGWSLEYDGADIGYLSATVSFLGKAWKINHDERLRTVMEKAVEFLSFFVYPDGSFAGSMGSRQTQHFYSHGCELLAPTMPLAGHVADAMLAALAEGKLVPAEIMADRYFLYRIPEHLESYIDYGERQEGQRGQERQESLLPYERGDFRKVFPDGKFFVEKKGNAYVVASAAKGGVLKIYRVVSAAAGVHGSTELTTGEPQLRARGEPILLDCGLLGRTTDGEVLTSQWVDPSYTFSAKENGFSVSGALHRVPAHKLFTPFKNIVFRAFLLLVGWHTGAAYRIKGLIRRLLMLTSGSVPAYFYRKLEWTAPDHLRITDVLTLTGKIRLADLRIGGEFAVRYVPQSRYFQDYELSAQEERLSAGQLKELAEHGKIHLVRDVDLGAGTVSALHTESHLTGTMGVEYSEGRKKKLSLTYRLQRRAEEMIRGIRKYFHGEPKDLLDLGPAEGKVLSKIQDAFPGMRCTGLEYSQELIDACTDSRLRMVQGDAMHPPFPDQSFDVVTASALIEHVESPSAMLREVHRVLRPGGIVFITTPDPFFEHIATVIGHLPEEQHQETMTLPTLEKYLREAGFDVLALEKFMVSPWGVPGERAIEAAMKKIGLGRLLLNQLAIGRKAP